MFMPLLVCPNCKVEMQAVNREGVEIDICTNCQGIWLDKGELEKIISKSAHHAAHAEQHHDRNEFWLNIFDIFDK